MSTSLLYHGFGVRNYKYINTLYEGGFVIFTIRQDPKELACSSCGSHRVIRRGQVRRRFRTIPIGLKPVWIELAIGRVFCPACDLVRQVKVEFADQRRSYTKAFERYALELSRHMTILDVARHLGVSWDVIKDIQKRNLKKRFSRPKLRKLKQIAIDEISIGRGHHYLTIVLDLVSGAVVFVGDGKGVEALEPFWKRVRKAKARIKAVAIDMSPSYISAVWRYLPEAAIVFDHFHIIKLFNDGLSDLRRKLYHEAEVMEKKVIKGTRWLLLKNPENLDEKRNEPRRLKEALEFNQPLATAYYMKEDLRQFWKQADKKTAENFLIDWVYRAGSSGISMLKKFARTLALHRTGILAYYDYPISTGPLEGTNNKIKTMKRQAYGFRDLEFFKLKIMAIHESKYALVG
ncbi:MAG: ISL3 family transposase [Deltaproteobacteria bacterium]|nr:ISL3 family transposase [Deltaproteobacteria bacterium]